MGETQPSDPLRLTLDYYEQNAEAFDERTRNIDMSPIYEEFLPLLTAGSYILDAGCGTGRDSAAFLERGFNVLAMDASKAMVERASRRIGRPVLNISFHQMQFHREFDGIWACASLLHVPRNEMPAVFQDFRSFLVPGGILYASFKRGKGEAFREGRLFNDYEEDELSEFIEGQRGWHRVKTWRTEDIRQHRANVQWVNLLARTSGSSV
jgi:SAM-dependent methyltransferase